MCGERRGEEQRRANQRQRLSEQRGSPRRQEGLWLEKSIPQEGAQSLPSSPTPLLGLSKAVRPVGYPCSRTEGFRVLPQPASWGADPWRPHSRAWALRVLPRPGTPAPRQTQQGTKPPQNHSRNEQAGKQTETSSKGKQGRWNSLRNRGRNGHDPVLHSLGVGWGEGEAAAEKALCFCAPNHQGGRRGKPPPRLQRVNQLIRDSSRYPSREAVWSRFLCLGYTRRSTRT